MLKVARISTSQQRNNELPSFHPPAHWRAQLRSASESLRLMAKTHLSVLTRLRKST